ncbi:MFS general substrate transporter, partial [Atractiella rhizophila]
VYIGSAIYSPSIPGVMERFHVSYVRGVLGLSLFVIGYGIGPLFLSPLSEIPAIGRNPPYIYTLLLFVIFQIPTFTTSNYETLMTFRFLTGFVGSPALATGGASMADIWPGIKLPYVIALWAVGAVSSLLLLFPRPVVGGFAAQNNGYKWPLYELIWICGFSCILLIFILPETYAPKILLKRAQRLRKLTGNNKLRSQSEIDQANLTLGEIASEALLKPFQLMMEPAVLFINVYLGLTYSIFYLWFEAFPIVFGEIYHFNLGEQGLPFVGFAITCMLSFAVYAAAQKYIYEPRFMRNGTIIPEERLEVGLVCCFFIPVSLFFYGWSSRESVHWIAPIIAAALYMPGIFLMFQVCLIYLPMSYPRYQASVLAGNDFFRSCMAGCFPLFGRALFKNLGVGPGCSLLAGLEIGLIPVLYVSLFLILFAMLNGSQLFYFKGAQFRSWSKYAQSS